MFFLKGTCGRAQIYLLAATKAYADVRKYFRRWSGIGAFGIGHLLLEIPIQPNHSAKSGQVAKHETLNTERCTRRRRTGLNLFR